MKLTDVGESEVERENERGRERDDYRFLISIVLEFRLNLWCFNFYPVVTTAFIS